MEYQATTLIKTLFIGIGNSLHNTKNKIKKINRENDHKIKGNKCKQTERKGEILEAERIGGLYKETKNM